MKTSTTLKKLALLIIIALSGGYMNAQCAASFTFVNNGNGNMNFTSTSVGTGSTTMYYWQFGNGQSTWAYATPTINYTYPSNGIYTVTLSINDSVQCNSSIALTLTVNNVPCNGSASFNSWQGQNGVRNFINTSTTPPAGNYNWAFGDGGTSTLYNPSHTYTAAGVYNVTLTASDQLNICTYSTVQTITVSIIQCSLSASFTYTIGQNGNVNFSSTSTGTTNNTNYYWYFGDGGSGSGANTSHTYMNNGTFGVLLFLSDSINFTCYDSIGNNITLTQCFANANFSMAKDSSMVPSIVWNAYPTYPNNVTAVEWSWGDGSFSQTLYPSHTFSAAGMYNICLSVTVACNATTSVCYNSNVWRSANAESNAIVKVNVVQATPTGIKPNMTEKVEIGLSPNPNNGDFELRLTGIESNSVKIHVYDLIGKEVYQTTESSTNGSLEKKINLSELSNGAYLLNVVSEKGKYNTKLIINK